jgi:hypothetical protein
MARLQNQGARTITGIQLIKGESIPFSFTPKSVLDFDDEETVEKLLTLYPTEVKDLDVAASSAVAKSASAKKETSEVTEVLIPKK